MRIRNHALAILLPVLLAACAGSTNGGTTPSSSAPPPVPLASLIDPMTAGVARLDITALMRSPHYQSFVDLASLMLELDQSGATGFMQAFLRAQEIIIYLAPSGDDDVKPVILLRGMFTDGDARRVFPPDASVSEEVRDGILRMRYRDGLLALVGDHTIIMGMRDVAEGAITRQLEGGSGHLPNDSGFGTLIADLGLATSNAGYAVALTPRIKAEIAEEIGIPEAVLAPFTGLGVQVTLTDRLEIRGTMMSDSSIQAAALLLVANQIIARLRNDPDAGELGIAGALGEIMLRRDGGNLMLSLGLSNEQLQATNARAAEALRQEAAARAAEATTAEPAPAQ